MPSLIASLFLILIIIIFAIRSFSKFETRYEFETRLKRKVNKQNERRKGEVI